MLISDERRDFDDVLEEVLAELPQHLHDLLQEVPLVVEDRPSRKLLGEMGLDPGSGDLCGLHTGIPLTERSVEHSGSLPDRIMIFREPIMDLADYWRPRRSGASRRSAVRRDLAHQIRITVLHEIGHHFGLDEGDLEALGYG